MYRRLIKIIKLFLIAVSFLVCGCANKGTNSSISHENLESLTYSMDSIPSTKYPVHECVSEDGMMKFRSWNTGLGGTMPVYGVLCQFRTSDGTSKTIDLGKDDFEVAWVSSVHAIHKDDGSTYYILTRSHRSSTKDGYMWVDAYRIDCDTLKHVGVIDGGDLDEEREWDDFSVNYDIIRWISITNDEGWELEYDSDSRNLYIPQTEDGDFSPSRMNDRYRVFHFNGKKFVDSGVTCHKGLHESLADYAALVIYFRTKNYIVRVDSLANGDYRYASWKVTSTMKDKPGIVIAGKKHDLESNSYTFVNNGVEYIVGFKDKEPTSEGMFFFNEFLLVRKNGKVILKEEKESPPID